MPVAIEKEYTSLTVMVPATLMVDGDFRITSSALLMLSCPVRAPPLLTVNEEPGVKITSLDLPGARFTVPAEVVEPVKVMSADGAVKVAVLPVATFSVPLLR